MSTIRANSITNSAGTGAPDFPNGLTVNGSPVSGTQTFTAKGTIPNGAVVGLNLDGTISVVDPYYGNNSVAASSLFSISTAAYDPVNGVVMVAYTVNTTTDDPVNAVAGTLSGTTITFGTPAVVDATASIEQPACLFDPDSGNFVIAYRDVGGQGRARVASVSGTSITFGTSVQFESGTTTSDFSMTYDTGNSRVVIAYRDGGNSGYGTAVVGTVTGTAISFGTPVVFESASVTYTSCVYDSANGKVVIAYRDGGNSSYGTAVVGTVSGTSISFGTPVVFSSTSTLIIQSAAFYDTSSGKIILGYTETTDTAHIVLGTVSGTSISFGSPTDLFPGSSLLYADVCCCYNASTGDLTIGFTTRTTASGGRAARLVEARFDGTSITYNQDTLTLDGGVDSGSLSVFPVGSGCVAAWGNGDCLVKYVDMSSTARRLVGFAAESISNGASGSVTIKGGSNESQSGLTIGARYGLNYVTGLPVPYGGDRDIGYALSATKLYVTDGGL